MQMINRRGFMGRCLIGAATAGALGVPRRPVAETVTAPPLCVFSKHLQFLAYPALAKTCRELGLDGVDLTVRQGGHVHPERVARELPEAVDAIRAEGLEVPMITTAFKSGGDDTLRTVLETAKQCGIPYFRVGGHKYSTKHPILEQLAAFTEDMRGLARIAEELGLVAGYHNHSGKDNVGAPLWDLHRMYETIGSRHLGSNFDVGHATVEGAYGDWEITARLMAPWVRMVAVKDFVFSGNQPRWVPLGKGVVDMAACLRIFREQAGFSGPVSMHFEYKIHNHDHMLEEVAKAAHYMRNEVYPKAGFTV